MKQQQGASSIIGKTILALLTLSLVAFFVTCLAIQPKSDNSNHKDVLRSVSFGKAEAKLLSRGEIIFTDGSMPGATGWRPINLPNRHLEKHKLPNEKSFSTAWIKVNFKRGDLPNELLGFITDFTYGNIEIYLNGVDFYRNYSYKGQPLYYWNKPQYSSIPNSLLAKDNVLLLRIDPDKAKRQSVFHFVLGADRMAAKLYQMRAFVDNLGPQSINNLVLAISFMLLFLWSFRKKEVDFAWIASAGVLMYIRNLHYYVEHPVVFPLHFAEITNAVGVFQLFPILGYAGHFMKVPNFRRYIVTLAISTILLFLIFVASLIITAEANSAQLYFVLIIFAFYFWLCLEAWRRTKLDNLIMILSIGFPIFCLVHDYGLFTFKWLGLGFFLAPFSTIFTFIVFGFTLGHRILNSFSAVENLNVTLEQHVADATEKLRASEIAHREVQIALALETERERIMGEIHDRIGSSLVTTLASAKRNSKDSIAIPALKRAITDLKIAVDSLEPIEGDIIALLANLRHRLEPDLKDAGINFEWRIIDVPKLNWLDAVSSLHVLRILQEAIANIVSHSGAKTIKVESLTSLHNLVPGVAIILKDDGCGFETETVKTGRGINNMKSRAKAIGGHLEFDSIRGTGTKISLWLPIIKPKQDLYITPPVN